MRIGIALALLLAEASMFGQIGRYPGGYPPGGYPPGGYPPGGYPPGGYPPGGGIPIPWPRGGKRGPAGGTQTSESLGNFDGTLRRLEEKSIEIEAGDGRMLNFQRSSKTRFYKNSQEINASELKAGDRVSVEARQDRQGYLYAVNVYFEKRGEAAPSETTTDAPPPVRDPEDPGPPTLRRGAPARHDTSASEEEKAPAPEAPAPAADPLIEKARAAAEDFSQKLPNYVCKEYMSRYASATHPADWKALDVVSSDLVYIDGKEDYRNLAINGKAVNKAMEQLDGSWSTGEFGTMLRDLLSRGTAARFTSSRESTIAGVRARVYRFEVDKPYSHWHVQVPSQSINPAYKGSVWIDPKNGRVLRIEMQARMMPPEFPMDTVESAVDYEYIRIGGGEFLLPVHAENLSCQRGTSDCSRNTIDFRNYHKYESDSSIQFDTATAGKQ